MKTTFSLRTLLGILTVTGVLFSLLAQWLDEVRRQERRYNKAVHRSVLDGSRLYTTVTLALIGNRITDARWEIHGDKLTPQTAQAIVEADLIVRLTSSSVPTNEVQAVLAGGFEQAPNSKQGPNEIHWLTWIRK